MRNVLAMAILAVLAPGPARAREEGAPRRVTAGVRTGFGTSAGSAYADGKSGIAYSMAGAFSSQVPFQLDVAFRPTEWISVGGYASYGFDVVGSAVKATCANAGKACTAHTARLGVQVFYRVGKIERRFDPWVAVGLGWEWSTYEQAGGFSASFSGPEVPSLEAGVEYEATPRMTIGPWVQLAVGRFTRVETSAPAPYGTSTVDAEPRFHEWVAIGIRGTLDL